MRIEIDRSRASQPFALPTGQSHTIQLTVNVVFMHGRDVARPQDEAYPLVSSDGSYDQTIQGSAGRPNDESRSCLGFFGFRRGQRLTLYHVSGGAQTVVMRDVNAEDLLGPPRLSELNPTAESGG